MLEKITVPKKKKKQREISLTLEKRNEKWLRIVFGKMVLARIEY
jgi:hypothetical protein